MALGLEGVSLTRAQKVMSNDLPAQDVKRQVCVGANSPVQWHLLTPVVQQASSVFVDTTFASDMVRIQGMHARSFAKET